VEKGMAMSSVVGCALTFLQAPVTTNNYDTLEQYGIIAWYGWLASRMKKSTG
jgi:hypothetical protein